MSFKSSKSILKRLLWKEPALISTIDDLVILESQDVDKIRKKLSKNFNVRRKFRWRFHPQEDISVIHYAGARASRKAVSCLVEQGADVNSQTNSQGLTPLHFAVLFSNLDVMEELVNRGANINAKEFGRGYTPLHYACERRNLGAVKCLLGLLADQDILDDCGRTPLAMAKDMNCDQICKVLTGCKQASDLKTNITFLAGEQVRQKEQLQDFKDEVQKKFEEYDYWRNMMENRVSEAEKYQNLRSMREARQAKPMFFSQQISSRASSVSNLSEESESHRPKIMHISGNRDIGGGSMRNLAKKFEDFPAFERRGQTRRMNSSASSYSISTMSSVFSEHDSGLCSRPESRISGAIEIGLCELNLKIGFYGNGVSFSLLNFIL